MVWVLAALLLIIAVFVILYAVSVYFYNIAIPRNKTTNFKLVSGGDDKEWNAVQEKIAKDIEYLETRKSETVSIKSHDGLALSALYFPSDKDTGRFVICAHGYKSSGLRDFSGVADYYLSNNVSMLIIDHRSHGKSEGNDICFGTKSRYDISLWAKYLVDRFGKDITILLDGVSMGATTVLGAVGLDLPDNVCGAIADCGYTSMWDIFSHLLHNAFHLPRFPLLYICDAICKHRMGFGFKDFSTVESLKNAKIPVFFAHGSADNFVPSYMSENSYNACVSRKELYICEGASHGLSFVVDPDEYKRRIETFFPEFFGKKEN